MLGLNEVEIHDISVAIRPGMVMYPGDPTVQLERVRALAGGAAANVSRLDFGVHTGTHVDAPAHFIDGAPAAETLSLQVLVGPARVVDATRVAGQLDSEALAQLELAERVLFKIRNSMLWEQASFVETSSP